MQQLYHRHKMLTTCMHVTLHTLHCKSEQGCMDFLKVKNYCTELTAVFQQHKSPVLCSSGISTNHTPNGITGITQK